MIFLNPKLQTIRDELVIERTESAAFFRFFELSFFRDSHSFRSRRIRQEDHEKAKVRKNEKEKL